MRLNFTKKIVLTLGLVTVLSIPFSQAQEFTEIFKSPEQDAETFLNSYIKPGMLSFANGMAGGWYNTAKAHKSLGFDITVTLNVANIPSSERTFIMNSADYLNLRNPGNANEPYPTLVGGTNDMAQLTLDGSYTDPRTGTTYTYNNISTFAAPKGFDVSSLPIAGAPVPMIQLGIGIIKNTDIKIRYGKLDDSANGYKLNLFGIGILHDFKQWIPAINHMPFDMSFFFGFSRFKTTIDINEDVTGEFYAAGQGEMTANNTTYQILVSKKIAILTPYLGIGYNSVGSTFKVSGEFVNYNLVDSGGNPFRMVDPIDLSFSGGSSFRTTLGFRIKLAIITLHVDYTLQKYNMLTAGFGVSVR